MCNFTALDFSRRIERWEHFSLLEASRIAHSCFSPVEVAEIFQDLEYTVSKYPAYSEAFEKVLEESGHTYEYRKDWYKTCAP